MNASGRATRVRIEEYPFFDPGPASRARSINAFEQTATGELGNQEGIPGVGTMKADCDLRNGDASIAPDQICDVLDRLSQREDILTRIHNR